MIRLLTTLIALCPSVLAAQRYEAFGPPVRVPIAGYDGDVMEPFITRDGRYLLFNNRNDAQSNTDLHIAWISSPLSIHYLGPIRGANGAALDAVASVDQRFRLYFVSTRDYFQTLDSVFRADLIKTWAYRVDAVPGVSMRRPGALVFDAEISADGQTLWLVDGEFSGASLPDRADLSFAVRHKDGFHRPAEAASIMAAVNSSALEYAPSVSVDGLELFYTRYVPAEGFSVWRSTRPAADAAFNSPERVSAIPANAEATTISPDSHALYFHALVDNRYVLMRVAR